MERVDTSNTSFDYRRVVLNTNEKWQIEKSGTYAACEQMIQMSFMMMQLATLDQILERFEKNGRLTPMEHQSLLEHARQLWDMHS